MKIRAKCPSCRKMRWFLRQRKYFVKEMNQYVTSNNELCGKCARDIKHMIN